MADRVQKRGSQAARSGGREQERIRSKRREREQRRRKQLLAYRIFSGVLLCIIIGLALHIVQRVRRLEHAVYAEDTASGWQHVQQEQHVQQARHVIKGDEDDAVESENIASYARTCEVGDVDAPAARETWEIEERLAELARTDEKVAEIWAAKENYPDKMLEALANNPEMADYVQGYTDRKNGTESGDTSAELTEEEKGMEYPLFLQWDPRWGYVSYGDDSYVGLAGCGPTALSMALYYLTKDVSLTPDAIAKYAMEHDYYMYGTGTLWALMEDVPVRYGVKSQKPQVEEWSMKRELDEGHILICAMRPGDFTASGHFIVIYGYNEEGFLVNDPNCVARSRKEWTFEQIKGQIKQLWALGK